MDALVDFILAQNPVLVVLLLLVLSGLENVFPPVPADVAAALGAFWAVRTGHNAFLVGGLCFLANQMTAIPIYLFARSRGAAVLRSQVFRTLMPPAIQAAVATNINRYGILGVFVSRFLPGIRVAVLPFAAIHGLSPARTLIPAGAASLVWYAILTVVGSALGLAYEDVRTTVARLTGALGAVGITLLIVVGVLLWRAAKRARLAERGES
jgi:membrane protein DedA with SNARE-associated domain